MLFFFLYLLMNSTANKMSWKPSVIADLDDIYDMNDFRCILMSGSGVWDDDYNADKHLSVILAVMR